MNWVPWKEEFKTAFGVWGQDRQKNRLPRKQK